MAFHKRFLESIAMCEPYEDTDEQRQVVWDCEMLVKELRPLYRQLSLKARRLRRCAKGRKYLFSTLDRKKTVLQKLNRAEDILAWSMGH
tara:strand:+ start:125 stop:391 length:267 start_codon:yes stop_codon:yes gene_type:complete